MNLDQNFADELIKVTVEKLRLQLAEAEGLEARASKSIGEMEILLMSAFPDHVEKYMEIRVFCQATGAAIALPRPETEDVNSDVFAEFVTTRAKEMVADCVHLITLAEQQEAEDGQDG